MTEETFKLDTESDFAVHVNLWTPETPRAVLQVIHGMAEHSARYRRLAEALAPHGYAVIAHDQRGHGHTVQSDAELGFLAEHDGWAKLVADARAVTLAARERFPGLPLVVFGHSMGSYVAQSYLFQYDDVEGAVLSGSSLNTGALVGLGRTAAAFESWRKGRRGRSWLLQRLSFGEFARTVKDRKTDFDWLSRDPAEVDQYIRDPLCGFDCSAGMWSDMLEAFKDLEDPTQVARIREDLPMYLMSGSHDPVNEQGPGFERLKAHYGTRLTDLTARLYPEARHELLNETNRDEITDDLREWLDRVTTAAPS